ncbi:hypothetical protein [Streptomyces sp. STR69]|uniref:hypothetical protein n=1 Tax=Streptomyces sp. STR69 TaxID=1796942 RepID=UPI0021CA1933|nr:hypothetical protein [Streptomyces sp. STR69]
MQPTAGLLLENVPARRLGVASAVFNTSRQIGGALAVTAFGTLLARRTNPLPGLRASLFIAAVIVIATATANVLPERRGALNS